MREKKKRYQWFLVKKFKVKLNTALTIMVVIAILSELIKITEYIVPYSNDAGEIIGVYFKKTGLPFHLCSIQVIFVIIARIMKDGPAKQKLLASGDNAAINPDR